MKCAVLTLPLWGGTERSEGEGIFGNIQKDPSRLLRSHPPHKGEGIAVASACKFKRRLVSLIPIMRRARIDMQRH